MNENQFIASVFMTICALILIFQLCACTPAQLNTADLAAKQGYQDGSAYVQTAEFANAVKIAMPALTALSALGTGMTIANMIRQSEQSRSFGYCTLPGCPICTPPRAE